MLKHFSFHRREMSTADPVDLQIVVDRENVQNGGCGNPDHKLQRDESGL